jgi:phosphate-selective porin OprO and OprP
MTGGLKTINRYLLASAGVIGIFAASPEAKAQQAQDLQQIQTQIQEMQATIQALQKQVQDAKAQAAAANAAAANAGGSDLDLKVKWKGAPELSSTDGKFSFKVRGRVMVDYNGIDQDEKITGEGDINAVELRRARLGVEGVVFYDWKYKFEIEFAGDEVEIKDAYLAYANWWGAIETSEIRIGNQYVYSSLEQITSSRFITFLERAAFTDPGFLPSVEADRQIGAAVVVGDEHWSLQTGAYGASVGEANDVPGQEEFDTDKLALTVRGTVAPINREVNGVHQVVHLGASFRHRDAGELNDCGFSVCNDGDPAEFINNDGNVSALFQYRARGADLHLADAFVDTPQFADEDNMWHLEAAFVWGSFSMQGEYAENEVTGFRFPLAPGGATASNLSVNPTYTGWYADASWYLTGETRNYLGSEGIFGRTKVKNPVWGGSGGWGAWQIAGRYDVLDLSDKAEAMNAVYGCSECGTQETWLFGLNWLLTDYTALKLQVSQSRITGSNGDNEPGSGFNKNKGADITGVGLRWQVDW